MSHASRIEALLINNKCSIKKVPFERLNQSELEFVFSFISENKWLNDRAFKGKAHYLFIDLNDIPKNHIEIIEVLMAICKVV